MHQPDCREHAALVLDLARGRLDDRAAAEAEQVRRSCPRCSAWWQRHLEGEAVRVVAEQVEQVFSSFQPVRQRPARRRRRSWLAAAAALLLAVSGAVWWHAGGMTGSAPGAPPDTAAMIEQAFEQPATEGGDLNHDGVVDASDLALALRHST